MTLKSGQFTRFKQVWVQVTHFNKYSGRLSTDTRQAVSDVSRCSRTALGSLTSSTESRAPTQRGHKQTE